MWPSVTSRKAVNEVPRWTATGAQGGGKKPIARDNLSSPVCIFLIYVHPRWVFSWGRRFSLFESPCYNSVQLWKVFGQRAAWSDQIWSDTSFGALRAVESWDQSREGLRTRANKVSSVIISTSQCRRHITAGGTERRGSVEEVLRRGNE